MEVIIKIATVINFLSIIYFILLQWKTNDLVEKFINQLLTDVANLKKDVEKLKKISSPSDSEQD